MSKTTADYLRDLLHELADITAFTAEGEAAFKDDIKTQKAVIRSYEVIGEIAKRLPADLRNASPHIDWRKLITFRDFLAHNYDIIALRYVWQAVADVPALRAAVESLLAGLDSPDENS